jgi:hypothetical protein
MMAEYLATKSVVAKEWLEVVRSDVDKVDKKVESSGLQMAVVKAEH